MRTISADGLTKLATRFATEPIVIIAVDWTGNGNPIYYADRDIEYVKGKIIEVGDLDNVVNVLANNSSQQISVKLDDTDGTIKAIMDTTDVHKRNAWVYQYFSGLALSDKFLLFRGKVSSPLVWNEGDRTISFTIVDQLEDKEIGFSAEEGQFPYLPKDIVGKAWPMVFGTVLDSPTLQLTQAVKGTTLGPVGIITGMDQHRNAPLGGDDCEFYLGLSQQIAQAQFLGRCENAFMDCDAIKSLQFKTQAEAAWAQIHESMNQHAQQDACARQRREDKLDEIEEKGGWGNNPVKVFGGEDFPQNTPLRLSIGGGFITGKFVGDLFYISAYEYPEAEEEAEDEAEKHALDMCASTPSTPPTWDFEMEVCPSPAHPDGRLHDYGGAGGCTATGSGTKNSNKPTQEQALNHHWFEAGTTVTIADNEPITYIVSIVPGTVLAVKAFKVLSGERKLVNVPNEYWYAETKTYGSITAVQIVVTKLLSKYKDQQWEDELYVTFQSSVGPNTVDILQYLITTYSDFTCDTTTFNAVKTSLTPFPSNFPILDRKNILQVLQEIAFQARCAIWIKDGVFYLKYLPLEPTSDSTITETDCEASSVIVELTNTEDLVTKMKVRWRTSWADELDPHGDNKNEHTFILRHNVAKYGIHEEEYDWYIYNQPDIIYKVATFWLIRKANTWKRIKFRTFLQKLQLETFDTVTLDFNTAYVASSDMKAIVEKANYNSADQVIEFECWCPVKAGQMTKYPFAWPAEAPITETFPTADEIAAGYAGGGGVGMGATGELPIGDTSTIESGGTVFVGGPNIVFRQQSDWGDRHPTDVGFTAQQVVDALIYATLDVRAKPKLDLKLNYRDKVRLRALPPMPKGVQSIDLQKTMVTDVKQYGLERFANLGTFFRGISGNNVLVMSTGIKLGDQAHDNDMFFFRYDEEQEKWVAGAAYLKDLSDEDSQAAATAQLNESTNQSDRQWKRH